MRMGLLIDEKERNEFLQKSGYERIRAKMLKSLSLKDFLLEIERHACA